MQKLRTPGFLLKCWVIRTAGPNLGVTSQAQSDPHQLSRFRVNGPLSNMPEFAAAFACKASDAMVCEDSKRCQIW